MCPMRWLATFFLMFLGGCAHIDADPDKEPLEQVWVVPRSSGVVKNCIIRALDDRQRTYSRISPSIKHTAKTISPDGTVEIRPVDRHEVVDLNYYVRLEKIHDEITRIAFHSAEEPKLRTQTVKALSPCGSTP